LVETADRHLLTSAVAPPDVIAYHIAALAAERACARRHADATIFKGFMP
jgi:hypothetical protein